MKLLAVKEALSFLYTKGITDIDEVNSENDFWIEINGKDFTLWVPKVNNTSQSKWKFTQTKTEEVSIDVKA